MTCITSFFGQEGWRKAQQTYRDADRERLPARELPLCSTALAKLGTFQDPDPERLHGTFPEFCAAVTGLPPTVLNSERCRAARRQPQDPTCRLPLARAKTVKVGGRCFSWSVALCPFVWPAGPGVNLVKHLLDCIFVCCERHPLPPGAWGHSGHSHVKRKCSKQVNATLAPGEAALPGRASAWLRRSKTPQAGRTGVHFSSARHQLCGQSTVNATRGHCMPPRRFRAGPESTRHGPRHAKCVKSLRIARRLRGVEFGRIVRQAFRGYRSEMNQGLPPFLSQGETARLFPVLSTTSKEGRTTAILLAC